MKKELYLTLCALATTLPVVAQQRNFQITGTLCDSITHEAQAFATIRLLDKTAKDGAAKGAKTAVEKVLRVATTEANGKFKLTVPKAGNYTLEAVVIGMQPLRRDVTLSTTQPTLKLDTLYIKEYSNQLGQPPLRHSVRWSRPRLTKSVTPWPTTLRHKPTRRSKCCAKCLW